MRGSKLRELTEEIDDFELQIPNSKLSYSHEREEKRRDEKRRRKKKITEHKMPLWHWLDPLQLP